MHPNYEIYSELTNTVVSLSLAMAQGVTHKAERPAFAKKMAAAYYREHWRYFYCKARNSDYVPPNTPEKPLLLPPLWAEHSEDPEALALNKSQVFHFYHLLSVQERENIRRELGIDISKSAMPTVRLTIPQNHGFSRVK